MEKLRIVACKYIPDAKYCVITVPAYFNEKQKDATRNACELAGLECLDIIEESTAAAISLGLKTFDHFGTRNILVFDFGGGTLDLTIVQVVNKNFTVIAIDGDPYLGG